MSVFTLPQAAKETALVKELSELVAHHRAACPPYARILDASGAGDRFDTVADLPWLPVRLFKNLELKSIGDDEVFKVLTSSGTTGEVSRIYLDKAAAATQTRMLGATVQSVLGPKRLPMLLVDTKSLLKDRRSFSARGAGVLGMATFGRDHVWALDSDGKPDVDAIRGFLAAHGDQPFLIFGFTYLVWLHLYEVAREHGLDLSNGTLIHSGGWKKLVDQAVDPDEFRRRLRVDAGLTRVHNFYGMVEQIGTIFLEGPSGGSLYCPDFADVVVRDPDTWAELPPGKPGLLEVVSTLPTSYPGHVLLTEDLGVVHGVDDGDWPGKRFSVRGRLPRAEARGCSDTYQGGAAPRAGAIA
ncbi:LuxE/PaaK family acyltransferase [Mangrovihabitans endophyticus]|uniref:Acyl-protein synthetase n=1 Tax=Mangrovihabitans endophyticus TaxID=1751298 RepID=A0A8J3FP36_9ACTN|nr:acyl-protein synthetase [Mangrovihabitans endophyticus]GGK98025.1 acyl-protein synthetase [Mangrovihabitans endophyticus]